MIPVIDLVESLLVEAIKPALVISLCTELETAVTVLEVLNSEG